MFARRARGGFPWPLKIETCPGWRSSRAAPAAEELAGNGLDVRVGTLDVADGESVRDPAARVAGEFGGLDVLVNNAAAFADWSETASRADLDNSRAVLDTNLFGTWRVCQAFLPPDPPEPARSDRGRRQRRRFARGPAVRPGDARRAAASYGISKAAVNALTAKLASELDGTGILVNFVDPGLTATAPGMEEMGAPDPRGCGERGPDRHPPGRRPVRRVFRDGEPMLW